MREFWKALIRTLEGGSPACLVSLISSGGSTPRDAGAMMSVFPDGASVGTIGGGNVEFTAQKLAADVLISGTDTVRDYRFVPNQKNSLGMVCGGDVTVQFQYIAGGDLNCIRVLHALLEADAYGRDTWLVRQLKDGCVTAMGIGQPSGFQFLPESPPEGLLSDQTVMISGTSDWISIPVVKAGWVHIFGAGHVSRALAAALNPLGFRCAIYDDRAEFTAPHHFPTAERLQLCDYNHLHVSISPSDYVVVMTRGHEADYEVLTQILRSGARYIGCIGSRKKLALCRQRLLDNGFTPEEYDIVHAPIGLSIGAQTPEEIAVSVAAELISIRSGAFIDA